MTLEEELFRKYQPIEDSLNKYGFILQNETYIYETTILNDDFNVIISVKEQLTGKVIDAFNEEEYTNFRVHRQLGEYASKVKEEYLSLLEDIRNHCFIKKNFVSDQAERLAQYILKKYKVGIEHPFEDDEDSTVFRARNKKWFGLVMSIERNKVSTGNDIVDVLNVKTDDLTQRLLEKEGIYTCYHMNKKKWVSIILDDTLDDEIIRILVDLSYEHVCPVKFTGEWIVPSYPDIGYIESGFSVNKPILWTQSANILVGDIVYLYISRPYSSIMYKCEVTQVDIPYEEEGKSGKLMVIRMVERYPEGMYDLNVLKEYDVKTVRGPRHMPEALSNYINRR